MSDLINRQDALCFNASQSIKIDDTLYVPYIDWYSYLSNLPSAEPKIIRCKCCEYGDQDEAGRWFCRSLGCQIGDEDGSGFCADAERRKDA